MLVSRRVLCWFSRVERVVVRVVWAVVSAVGRVIMEVSTRVAAVDGRAAKVGGESGLAIVQRWVVRVVSWVERAEAMMSMLSRKVVVSPDRISRSEGSEIWPESWAETRSMQAWSSSGRVGACEGSVVKVSIRICVLRSVERAVVRFWLFVSDVFMVKAGCVDRRCG